MPTQGQRLGLDLALRVLFGLRLMFGLSLGLGAGAGWNPGLGLQAYLSRGHGLDILEGQKMLRKTIANPKAKAWNGASPACALWIEATFWSASWAKGRGSWVESRSWATGTFFTHTWDRSFGGTPNA